MTERAAAIKAARDTHAQPCWCNDCRALTLEQLLDERAALLGANLRDGYEPRYERVLADELLIAIPLAERGSALRHLLFDKCMHAALDLLDETRRETYEVISQLADVLYDAIHAQSTEGSALHQLILDAICDRQQILARTA